MKSSIKRFGELDSENLANKIFSMGDALYKAHHQQLENFLMQRNFSKLYKVSIDLIQSPIVPTADRFVASLFYRTALRAAPRRQSMVDQIEDMMNISFMLIRLAREEKSPTLRCLAIGLARSAKLRYEINSLLANHNAGKAIGDGPEGYIFRLEIYKQYRSICLSIKKLIDLLGVAISKQQYHIFSDIYFESAASLSLFRKIQKDRGDEEAISFFQNWIFVTFQFCIVYLAVIADIDRAKRLYSLALHAELFSENEKESLRVRVSHINSDVLEALQAVEINHKPIETGDFLEASTLEQIKYFKDTARNMGMDPDDMNNEMGQIVAMALKNYDPTEILSNCEHLFVHYRPAGIIAQTLQLHSAGGMHLLVCLKHQHVHGTGNLLTNLYSPPSNIPMAGFRESHCVNCRDCSPRATDWKWSLAWQHEELPKHLDFLDKFNKW
jgi:hypothetical protein